jgi:hypothetical protein
MQLIDLVGPDSRNPIEADEAGEFLPIPLPLILYQISYTWAHAANAGNLHAHHDILEDWKWGS